jgi:glutamate-1-semialdehyde 2,1-aminomutase
MAVNEDRYAKSRALYAESQQYLAGGVSSNFRLGVPPFPIFYDRAEGGILFDVDGNSYVDYLLGMGPIVLGHAAEGPVRAVEGTLRMGQLFGAQSELEIEVGRKLCQVIPCAERVRYVSSGSEAVQLAFRLARGYTGKPKIVKFEGHYHGWIDGALVSVHPGEEVRGPYEEPNAVPLSKGQSHSILNDLVIQPWNNLELLTRTLERREDEIAGVIMEPVGCNTCVIPPRPGYLEGVRELCSRLGIVLIFDEVITGFRLALGGAQERFGVTPDLATYAKAIANGFPLAMVAGKTEIMEQVTQGVVHGGTYNGGVPVMAAALATLEALEADNRAAYARMEAVGEQLMGGLRAAAERADQPFLVQGYGAVFHTSFTNQRAIHDYRDYARHTDQPRLLRFVGNLMDEGVRVTSRGTWMTCAAHTDVDVDRTVAAAERAMRRL